MNSLRFSRTINLTVRMFCERPSLKWTHGPETVAKRLWEVYTVGVDEGPRCDPRGMRLSELKNRLRGLPEFEGDVSDAAKYHADVLSHWQKLYDDFMNGNVKLPGRDPAGPLTFHKPSDKECVRLLYDKHGRIVH